MRRPAPFTLTALLTILFAAIAVWPQGFGLAGWYGPAQAVAVRGLCTVAGLVALAALLLAAGLWRRPRPYLVTVAAVVAVATALSAAVVVSRGLGTDADAADTGGDVRVLAFNTLHDGVPATDLAQLVERHDADVVVLPETSRATAGRVAALAGAGFQVLHHRVDSITSATALLVADDVGVYTGVDPHRDGALGSFTAWPETRGGPPITAVHAFPPSAGTMDRWRDDTAWAADRCGAAGAIVAGDFNATLDHPALRDLGSCVDAAAARDAAAVGTWPAGWPSWAGAPIDHVLVDGRSWRVVSFTVLDALSGSDHRPVLAVLGRS